MVASQSIADKALAAFLAGTNPPGISSLADLAYYGSGSGGGGLGFVTPVSNNAMGAGVTIAAAQGLGAVFLGTLSAASCALGFTGFTVGKDSGVIVRITGSPGKTFTFLDTILWNGGGSNGYPPVASTQGTVEFLVYSEDGVNLLGQHGQQVRTLLWGPGNASTPVSALSSIQFPFFNDARIVDGIMRLVTTGTVQSTICDVNINGVTAFTTQANRPSVGIGATVSGAYVLPDIKLITPGQYVSYDVDQFGTSAAGLMIATRVLEAA